MYTYFLADFIDFSRKKKNCYLIVLFLLYGSPCFSQKSYFQKTFLDSVDQSLDLSHYLANKVGIIPIPILITEPAIGYGGGLSLVYFHRAPKKMMTKDISAMPPSISLLGGMATENGTNVLLLAHQGSYMQDMIRYTGALGLPDINLTFYGGGLIPEDQYKFNMNGFFTFQELSFRMKARLPLFVGLNYFYFNNKINFEDTPGDVVPQLETLESETNTAGLNFLTMLDTRDNIFTPNSGLFAAVEIGRFAKWLGGDRNYNNFALRFYTFHSQWINRFTFGFRANILYKWGDIPFYELPGIRLRGIPMMRYQNQLVNVLETEIRYAVWRRWSLVGFGGIGTATQNYNKNMLNEAKPAAGVGFRYFLAKKFGLHMGIDVAKGPEQFAWYLVFGSSWFR